MVNNHTHLLLELKMFKVLTMDNKAINLETKVLVVSLGQEQSFMLFVATITYLANVG